MAFSGQRLIILISMCWWLLSCQRVTYQRPESRATQGTNAAGDIRNGQAQKTNSDLEAETEDDADILVPMGGDADLGPATGMLTASVLFVPPNQRGRYAPNRLQAIWISDMNNQHLRTIDANPGRRPQHLRRWQAGNGAQVDGFTGATITAFSPDPVEFTWDLKNKNEVQANFGSYKIWFELTQSNTNDEFNDGDPGYAVYSMVVTLSSSGLNVVDNNHPVFTNITVTHSP